MAITRTPKVILCGYSTISQMNYEPLAAPPLPPSVTTVFGSIKCSGRLTVPPELHLKVAFAELKLDLTEALFPTSTFCWWPRPCARQSRSCCPRLEDSPAARYSTWLRRALRRCG